MAITPMSATLTAGSVETGDLLSNRIPIDMSPDITRKQRMLSPFTTLLDMAGAFETCTGRKFEWMERDDYQNTVTITSAFTAAGSTLTMTNDYVRLRLGDILWHPTTDQFFRVTTSGTMDTTVDVTPNFPTGSGGSNIAAGEKLYVLGDAQDEFSDVRQLIASKPSAKYNYIQQTRYPFGASGRVMGSEQIGPAEFDYLDEDAYRAFSMAREKTMLFGVRALQSSTNITATGGIQWSMNQTGSASPSRDMSGKVLTQAEWEDFLRDAMYYSSGSDKVLVTGRNPHQYINSFARPYLQVDQSVREWGLQIQQYNTPDGVLRIVRHKLFTELGMDDEAWVIDLGNVKRRGLAGNRSTPHLNTGNTGTGLQGNGEDGLKYEYAVEEGLELRHEESHARIYNVAKP